MAGPLVNITVNIIIIIRRRGQNGITLGASCPCDCPREGALEGDTRDSFHLLGGTDVNGARPVTTLKLPKSH